LKSLCEHYSIPRYTTSWAELLEDPDIDAVIVGLPHPLHAAACKMVLDAGKHLFIQKPLCASLEEADELVGLCEKNPALTVYCRPSFSPVVHTMRALIAAGAIGNMSGGAARHSHGGPEVYYAEVADAFGEPHQKENLWFFDAKQAGVGALFDMGVYSVANLVAVMGRAVSVTARLSTVAKPTKLEDTATLIIDFENGALGTAETSWCDPARTSFLRVHGTKGKLLNPGSDGHALDYLVPSSTTREHADPIVENPSIPTGENQHAEWLRHIRAGSQPEISNIWNARHVIEILLAAQRSSEEGRRIEVNSNPLPS
jgi:predicted dehydrogenase